MSRNQSSKTVYGRGKHSSNPNTIVHTSIQFDNFLCENTNKPTAAKSAGTVGKWGVTSFTSIRSATLSIAGHKESRYSSLGKRKAAKAFQKEPVVDIAQPRKFFKSRNGDPAIPGKRRSASGSVKKDKITVPATTVTTVAVKKSYRDLRSQIDINTKRDGVTCLKDETRGSPPKEPDRLVVYSSKEPLKLSISTKKATMAQHHDATNNEDSREEELAEILSPTKTKDKPPIVLRIFKGTSQLLSDPEDSDNGALADSHNIADVSEPMDGTENSHKIKEKKKSPVAVREEMPPVNNGDVRADDSEPTITVRSLRRRPTAEPPAQKPTSPKRVLRNTRSTAAAVVPGKLVISNLNSDNPVVYSVTKPQKSPTQNRPQPPLPHKKEYKHKNHQKNRKHGKNDIVEPSSEEKPEKQTPGENVEEFNDAETFKKAEQLLAECCVDSSALTALESGSKPFKTKLEDGGSSTIELLKVLESDGDEEEFVDSGIKSQDNFSGSKNTPEEPEVSAEASQSKTEPTSKPAEILKLKLNLKELKIRENSLPTEEVTELGAKTESVDSGCGSEEFTESSSSALTQSEASQPESANLEPSESNEQVAESSDQVNSSVETAITDDVVETRADIEEDEDSATANDPTLEDGGAAMAKTATKKTSIFKSRRTTDANKKRLALYKHKWVDEKDAPNNVDKNETTSASQVHNKPDVFSTNVASFDEPLPLLKVKKQVCEYNEIEQKFITSLRCAKKDKEFYTVVKNVKNAHQIQESGEFQEFNDDVEYILDALQDNNSIGTRCLSAISLATKCMEPAFRMHVRAHGTVTKFFKSLHDATKDQSLAMCTATVMFVLSQDRLNMDLDHSSLELMLNLLESDTSHKNALDYCGLTDSQLTKTRDKVRQICADIQAQGHAKHLNLDNITVGHLAMETLLSLTSKRAGEWFKEELRELGGLEHIVRTVVECCRHVDDTANAWSPTSLDKIRKVDRCLRVLENVTLENEQNNLYLLDFQDGILIDTLLRMYKVTDYEIPLYPTDKMEDKESTGAILRECLMANLKVLINFTHDYNRKSYGSSRIGSKLGVIDSSLHVLLQLPQYIPNEERFDLIILALILLINLVEHCDKNRKLIINAQAPSDDESIFETKSRDPAVKALVAMFYHHEQLARTEEKKTDAILEGEGAEKRREMNHKGPEEFVEETVAILLQKAGQHMEHTLIAAYVVLLLGYIIADDEMNEAFIRKYLPEGGFSTMISILQKFHSFMTLTVTGGTLSNKGIKSTQTVIQRLIESDKRAGICQELNLGLHAFSCNQSAATGSKSTVNLSPSSPITIVLSP